MTWSGRPGSRAIPIGSAGFQPAFFSSPLVDSSGGDSLITNRLLEGGATILRFFLNSVINSHPHRRAPLLSEAHRMLIRRLLLLVLLAIPGVVHAQGSRKDDIVLNRFGQPVAGASVTVCTAGAAGSPCSPLAAIFSDVGLTQPLANPLTSDGQGNYHFYAAPGRYMVQISGAGTAATTIPDVLLPADPTSPSFQSLSVTQNISALNLSLSGNLSVTGGVSSPSTVSAPQQGSTAPVQLGPHWYAGTASGLCAIPAAPAVTTETVSSGTGNFASGTTYYVKVTLYNRNGQTTTSPATAYTPASGSVNRMLVQLSDNSFRSGCFGYRVWVSSSGVNGSYYPAQAWTLPQTSIAGWSRNAAGLVTVTTSAAHGFIPGEYITIAGAATGGASTSINGSFTLAAQQGSTPTKLFFFQPSGLGADSAGSGGTGTVLAGLGSDSYGHMVPGDFIVAAVPTSGSAPPATNTATIDPDQVALNATCNYAANACASGGYDVPQGSITGTTPLILSNQQTVTGLNSAAAVGKSQRLCPWADPNLGCVMVIGTANGVRLEGMDIESSGNSLMFAGWGPGFGSSNDYIRNNNIVTSDLTGQYSAIRFHAGTWYHQHIENNLLTGGLADVQADAVSGGWWFFSGSRWNGANLASAGLSTNGFLSVSGVTDPDRAQLRAGFPNGVGDVEIAHIIYESGTGIIFDGINMGLSLNSVTSADSSAIAGTPSLIRVGSDANSGAAGNFDTHFENSVILPASGVSTGLQVAGSNGNFGGFTVINSSLGGAPNEIDLNNAGVSFNCVNSYCNTYAGATAHKVINVPATTTITTSGNVTAGTPAGEYAMNQLSQGTFFAAKGNQFGWIFYPISTARWGWWGSDPAACSNPPQDWSFNSGGLFRYFENDCATVLFSVNASNGANTVTHFGSGFRFNSNQALTNYFTFAGTPSAARTITWPDASGTVAFVLTGTSGSIGGSALAAGACTSGTASVSGAATSMAVAISPAADPGTGFSWMGFVSSSGTVTVRVCAAAAGTPTSTTYNIRVIQ